MRNQFVSIILSLCLAGMTTQVHASAPGNTVKTAKTASTTPTPKAGKIFLDCPGCPEMVIIPAGIYTMGSPDSEAKRDDNEGPVHRVKIASFAMGRTEITRGQFAAFVKKTKYNTEGKCWSLDNGKFKELSDNWLKPGYPQDDRHPVACINWNDAQAYVKWLSRKTGKKYRLPTEAEWEYAARGNTSTARYWGDNPNEACQYANAADKSAQAEIRGASSWSVHNCTDGFAYTSPVGSFKPNAFRLNDMLGNVWEWTEDVYHDSYVGAPVDEKSWQGNGVKHALRGGSWNNSAQDVRAAARFSNKPALRFSIFGFRVVRVTP